MKDKNMLEAKVAGVGARLPDLVLPTVDGRRAELNEFLGKRLLVFVWASW